MEKKEICIQVDAAQRLENLLISYNKAQNALDKLIELGDIPKIINPATIDASITNS